MKRAAILIFALLLTGCAQQSQPAPQPQPQEEPVVRTPVQETPAPQENPTESAVEFPVEEYISRRAVKNFGEYIQDRFTGYHVAEDVEFTDEASINKEIPVSAIADGTVIYAQNTSGYGGMIRVQHNIENMTISAIYGHVDLSSSELQVGDQITKGQFLANLGDHESAETDGERKHLHFGLYEGSDNRINGYESSAAALDNWINPHEFFLQFGMDPTPPTRTYNSEIELGGDIFNLSFNIPAGWEVEYVPSIQSLNLYTLKGSGTARERSQIFIRYFDASSFLTLNTVTIHKTTDTTVGPYTARRYDIEKNAGIADFPDQPSWRNQRHIVTDFRARDGFTRYFVVAANPELDPAVYEQILQSMEIQ